MEANNPIPNPTNPQPTAQGSAPPASAPAKPVAGSTPAAPVTAAKPATLAAPPPAPLPVPSALALVPLPFVGVDHALRGIHAEAHVAPEQVVEAALLLDLEGFSIDTITGVDWMAESQMEVIYDYFHPLKCLRAVVRTRIPRENPHIPTISAVFPGANWHERETHDFFGIVFSGHPNLEPFLLPEDATYHPLRKDFTSCS